MNYLVDQLGILQEDELYQNHLNEFHKATTKMLIQHYLTLDIEKFELNQKMLHIQLMLLADFQLKMNLFHK